MMGIKEDNRQYSFILFLKHLNHKDSSIVGANDKTWVVSRLENYTICDFFIGKEELILIFLVIHISYLQWLEVY